MTTMTIIDDLLVLFDDEKPRDLELISVALPDRSKQTLSSTLGRLTAKGWIERVMIRGKKLYRISKSGREHVTRTLNAIKDRVDRLWDGSWEEIIFNIPEQDRKRRDDLRRLMLDAGYGRLHNSLWISPWSHRKEIEEYIKESKSMNDISVVKTGQVDNTTNRRISEFLEWDWKSLDSAYKSFLKIASSYLKTKSKDSFEARRIVYHYAKILLTDPKLPEELPQRTKYAKEARQLYEKIRPYCY